MALVSLLNILVFYINAFNTDNIPHLCKNPLLDK